MSCSDAGPQHFPAELLKETYTPSVRRRGPRISASTNKRGAVGEGEKAPNEQGEGEGELSVFF